jgi:hypothetical protein
MRFHVEKRILGVQRQLVEKRSAEAVALVCGGERRSGGVQWPTGVHEDESTVCRQ